MAENSNLPAPRSQHSGPELMAPEAIPVANELHDYEGMSQLTINTDEALKLTYPVPVEHLEIKPTGEVYASQYFYRKRLNEVFGPGGWALKHVGDPQKHGTHIFQRFRLYIRGSFISEAVGECEYQESNSRMTYGDALEGVKSNALTRCCKDLSIAAECWDRRFCERFQDEHCIRVWVEGKTKPQWRRKDSRPFLKENGEAPASAGDDGDRGSGGAPSTQASRGGGDRKISEPQRKRLYAIWKKSGHSDPDVMAYLKSRWGIEKSGDIPFGKVYDQICARLEKSDKLGSLDDDNTGANPSTASEAPPTDDAGIPAE